MTTDIEERLMARAEELAGREQRRQARPEDYLYDKAQEKYWDGIDGTLHGEEAVDASIPLEHWRCEVVEGDAEVEVGSEGAGGDKPRGRPRKRKERLVKPSYDIRRIENDQFVEGSTWWPGKPRVIKEFLITKDGMMPAPGRRAFNTYNPPRVVIRPELAEGAAFWVRHVQHLWPDPVEHEYFFDYCAHMVQRPQEKCNAAIVLSGAQRIGKDAALAPVRDAVGQWNAKNIDPDALFSQFRPWLETVLLIVDEVRPSKDDFHASSMYNTMKPLIAAPPDTLALNDKNTKMRHIVNIMRVIMTTNDWLAMYIPPEDERFFIMHSSLPTGWQATIGQPDYFAKYWATMDAGGWDCVAAWLHGRDISNFNPKGRVVKTAGWQAVAGSWEANDDGVEEALEHLGRPAVVFGAELLEGAFDHRDSIAAMLKSPRKIAHRMQKIGYSLVKCPDGDRWTFKAEGGKPLRYRIAFARNADFLEPGSAIAAVQMRGKALAFPQKTTKDGF